MAAQWVSVEDDMPDDDNAVLIVVGGDVYCGWHDGDDGWVSDNATPHLNVTHWQPLPKPPEGT